MANTPSSPYAKAYAAALVAILLYVANGLMSGEWASTDTIAPALAIVLGPLVVYAVPNTKDTP